MFSGSNSSFIAFLGTGMSSVQIEARSRTYVVSEMTIGDTATAVMDASELDSTLVGGSDLIDLKRSDEDWFELLLVLVYCLVHQAIGVLTRRVEIIVSIVEKCLP